MTARSKTEGSRRWEPEEGPMHTHTHNTIEEKETAKRSETDRK